MPGPEQPLYSVSNRVDNPKRRAKLLFLGVSRVQNGVLFVFKIETGIHKATFRSVNTVGDT